MERRAHAAGDAAVPAPADVPRELQLLAKARRVVATDPARALALTAEHDLHHRDGVLAEEREVIAIEALNRLGQRALAEARARRFLRTYSGSAHRVRVSIILGGP